MNDVDAQAIEQMAGGKFAAIGATVKRARQLANGAPPLVDDASPDKPAMTAMREIQSGFVQVEKP